MPWSEEYLDSQKKKKFSPLSFFGGLVFHRETHRRLLDQFAELWKALPNAIQKDQDIVARLRSPKDKDLLGALNEVLAYWILRHYFPHVQKGREGAKTPDFEADTPDGKVRFEVFSLNEGPLVEAEYRNLTLFRHEIENIRSKYRISLSRPPRQNKHKNFAGLGKAMEKFFAKLDRPEEGKRYEVSHNGALVTFRVAEFPTEGKIYFGGIGGGHQDNLEKTLLKNMKRKLDKYKFPFIGICMVHSIRADVDTLVDALMGKLPFPHPRDSEGKPIQDTNRLVFDYHGFWGAKNRLSQTNNRITGLLYFRVGTEERKFKLWAHAVKNQNVDSKFSEFFTDIPDVLLSDHGDFRANIKPKAFRP